MTADHLRRQCELLRAQLAAEREVRRLLASAARNTLTELPVKRDWLDPQTEQLLRAGVEEADRLDGKGY